MNTTTIILVLLTVTLLGLGWRAVNKPDKPRVRREPAPRPPARASSDAREPRRVR